MLKLKLQYFGHLMQIFTHLKIPWCWEILKAGEGDNRGWDGWMETLTQWTWVWVNSRSWWWTGRPDVLQFMGSQRVGHNWAIELNWTWSIDWIQFWSKSQSYFMYIYQPILKFTQKAKDNWKPKTILMEKNKVGKVTHP